LSGPAPRCTIAAMSESVLDTVAASVCMNVRSFRKSGVPVDTPTWTIRIGDRLAAYTDDRSFKWKRMKNNPNVEIAACDVWGRCSSPWYPGRVRVVEAPEERERVFQALKAKYGIHYKMSYLGSIPTGRIPHRVVLEFEITPTPLGTTYTEG
jgi:uncharacterized protein